jgi:hypothetical protein
MKKWWLLVKTLKFSPSDAGVSLGKTIAPLSVGHTPDSSFHSPSSEPAKVFPQKQIAKIKTANEVIFLFIGLSSFNTDLIKCSLTLPINAFHLPIMVMGLMSEITG